jgi:ribonucleotide monophosphatase NagD (HAD superfamily)
MASREREIRSWLMDMDGVLVHDETAVPGADRFIARLGELELPSPPPASSRTSGPAARRS